MGFAHLRARGIVARVSTSSSRASLRRLSIAALVSLSLVACGGPGGSDAASTDASAAETGLEGGADAGALGFVATFGARTRRFDRVQFGFERADAGAGADASVSPPGRPVYLEAYEGGDPACPEMNSPTPLRTIVIAGLRVPSSGLPVTQTEGLVVSLVDFQGDLVSDPMPLRAASARVTVQRATLEPADDATMAIELDADFGAGRTVRGALTATHCRSLDE